MFQAAHINRSLYFYINNLYLMYLFCTLANEALCKVTYL